MLAAGENYDSSKITKVVYNDNLGYAIVYYKPMNKNGIRIPRSEDICNHRRYQTLRKTEDPLDKEFREEIEKMVRRKECEYARKAIEKTCERVHELFQRCEAYDMSRRDILNNRVKEQIKGKSADEICNVLVSDVLNHVKYIYKPIDRAAVPHKLKYKILAASVKRAPSPTRPAKPEKIVSNEITEDSDESEMFEKVNAYLDKNVETDIFQRKYLRLLDKIQNDIDVLKYRCTSKISRNY